jgi:hypothetical protein
MSIYKQCFWEENRQWFQELLDKYMDYKTGYIECRLWCEDDNKYFPTFLCVENKLNNFKIWIEHNSYILIDDNTCGKYSPNYLHTSYLKETHGGILADYERHSFKSMSDVAKHVAEVIKEHH